MKATALGLVVVTATTLVGVGSAGSVGAAAARDHAHQVRRATPGTHYAIDKPACTTTPKPGYAACLAIRQVPASRGEPGARRYTVPAAYPVGPSGHGLTPGDFATAYGFDPDRPSASQLVAIVDAYDDPNIEADLDQFDVQYGLPLETATSFMKVGQTGSPTSLPAVDTTGWSLEEALDVEAVRGVCHTCRIVLVETDSPQDSNLWAGVRTAVRLHATEISNSYGGPEGGHIPKSVAKEIERVYHHPGTVITAASGDEGWYTWDRVNDGTSSSAHSPNFPASLPDVVAVGGTKLLLNSDGTRRSERVWNNNGPADSVGFHHGPQGATGGGCSVTYLAKGWQTHLPGYRQSGCDTNRGSADISVDGDPHTGYDVYTSFTCASGCPKAPGWYPVGGTSLSAPVVAAMWALAGGAGGVALPSLTLYGHANSAHPPLYDVTVGGNSWCDGISHARCAKRTGKLSHGHAKNPNFLSVYQHNLGVLDCGFKRHTGRTTPVVADRQCNAAPGYDGPSGIGTPNGLTVFRPMSPRPLIRHKHAVAKTKTQFSIGGRDPFPGARFVAVHWRFGDGRGSHKLAPRHSYAKPGRYVLTLTVTDNYGQTATVSGHAMVGPR